MPNFPGVLRLAASAIKRNQTSNEAQDCVATGSLDLVSSISWPAVARAVGTCGAKAMQSSIKAVTEIVAAIFLNIILARAPGAVPSQLQLSSK
jgi:hypothetical protein